MSFAHGLRPEFRVPNGLYSSVTAYLFTDNIFTCELYADYFKLYTVLQTNADSCVIQDKLNELSK